MTDREERYLKLMLGYIERIDRYTKRGRDSFLMEQIQQDAVVRNLQLIGESSKRLSEETRGAAPDVAWRDVLALRNLLVHEYLRVEYGEVWQIIVHDLPRLRAALQALLEARN